jgi:hypothetical protein
MTATVAIALVVVTLLGPEARGARFLGKDESVAR